MVPIVATVSATGASFSFITMPTTARMTPAGPRKIGNSRNAIAPKTIPNTE